LKSLLNRGLSKGDEMMVSYKILSRLAIAGTCLALLAAGCTQVVKEPGVPITTSGQPSLTLKFVQGESATYKVVTEGTRSVTFEGSLSKDPALKGGQTGNRIEMTFTQEIESIDDKGSAVAKITIDQLKFHDTVKGDVVLDFDSSKPAGKVKALAQLIGQSYKIEIDPLGRVTRIVDTTEALAAVKAGPLARQKAQALLKPDTIKARHTISGIPAPAEKPVRAGDNWSKIENIDFDLMGAKAYEKIYVLKKVSKKAGRRIAVIEMNAIPTSETAQELYKKEGSNLFAKMFDNSIDTYAGRLELDMTTGEVRLYFEELKSEWLMVDPAADRSSDKEPDSMKMTAIRSHRLERID